MGPLLPSGRAQGGRGHQLRRVEVHATQVEEEGGVLIDAVGNLVHQSRQMLARLAGTAALRAKGAPSSEVGARALAIKDRKRSLGTMIILLESHFRNTSSGESLSPRAFTLLRFHAESGSNARLVLYVGTCEWKRASYVP